MHRSIPPALLIVCAMFGNAAGVSAQTLREQCTDAATGTVAYCESLADAAVSMPPRLAITAAGGNPVPGTASTLGMRVPGSPRWSLAVRGTLARAPQPGPEGEPAITPTLWSVNADASVGVFNGFSLLPTIGGFGSIDVLGSFGLLSLSEDGFERSSPVTWALGARAGILRESFTAPGVSMSVMYRSLPRIEFGDTAAGPYFENAGQNVLSLRGTVGKRILGLGLSAGVGYDRGSSDVRALYNEPGPMFPSRVEVTEDDVRFDRTSFFGNVSYTLLILNMAAELGWQESGERSAGSHANTGKGGLFGGIAVRLAI